MCADASREFVTVGGLNGCTVQILVLGGMGVMNMYTYMYSLKIESHSMIYIYTPARYTTTQIIHEYTPIPCKMIRELVFENFYLLRGLLENLYGCRLWALERKLENL